MLAADDGDPARGPEPVEHRELGHDAADLAPHPGHHRIERGPLPDLRLQPGDVVAGLAIPALEAPTAGQDAEPATDRRARADRAETQAVMERVIDRAEERIAEPVAAPGETLAGVAELKSRHESDLLCGRR
jgi:hypothetical protein